jgi:hypothetical protein
MVMNRSAAAGTSLSGVLSKKEMNKAVLKFGFWSGMIAFTAAIGFNIAQILQLVRILTYPWDEILIYGFSMCIVIPFVLEMLALHYSVPAAKKFWSHAALIFSTIYAVFVTQNYVVQLATVLPMTLQGAAEEVAILRQTPHSLFWNYDAVGYLSMGLATLFAAPVFEKHGFQKWVKYSFLVHGIFTTPLISFVYFYPNFSEKLLLVGIPWIITAPLAMLMLAILFRKNRESNMEFA